MTAKNIPFLLLLAACIAATLFIFQPGYMNTDAVDQLGQGRSGLFNDWHPPVMSWTWGLLDRIAPGPLGMFLLQVVLFWSGWGMLVSLVSARLLNRSLYLLIGFFPPVFMLLSAVIKDVLMMAVFLFGFALILHSQQRRSLSLFLAGLVFLAYGMLTRHNAVPAALPLFLYAGWAFTNMKSAVVGRFAPFWRVVLSGGTFFTVLLLLGNIWSASLIKIKAYPFQQVMVHDLTGISLKLKTDLLPEYLASSEQPSMKDLRHIYQTRSVKNLYWPDFTAIHFKILYEPEQVQDLTNIWIKTVVEHPRAYLDHRARVFAATMGISVSKACGPYYYEETIYKPKGYYYSDGNYFSASLVTDRLFALVEPLRESPLYWNWVYIFFSLTLFVLSLFLVLRKRANANAVVALSFSASGTLYGLAYFFAATACDFRLVLWNVAVTLASSLLLLHSKKQKTDP
ncbi:MAG: hypothetical protein HND47_05430 [Chloroflexi bacterium]|nr:hypothetical protein [Chloroflexota bacterium]